MEWTALLLGQTPEFPEGFVEIPVVPLELDRQWFRGTDDGDDFYALRIGDGAKTPHKLVVFVVTKPEDLELGVRWPTLEELRELMDAVLLEGAVVALGTHIAGLPMADLGPGTVLELNQVGALQGTPAGNRFALGGGMSSAMVVEA